MLLGDQELGADSDIGEKKEPVRDWRIESVWERGNYHHLLPDLGGVRILEE